MNYNNYTDYYMDGFQKAANNYLKSKGYKTTIRVIQDSYNTIYVSFILGDVSTPTQSICRFNIKISKTTLDKIKKFENNTINIFLEIEGITSD